MRLRDTSVPIIIVGIVLAFIIPLPEFVLDILLAVNIIVSVIILLNTVYMKEPLQLSIFPSLLVITTMFRLALNVSASRMIIGKGEAGEVIAGFGRFVGGDDLVVGFIIFALIMIVNFLVITRGSERVAEVAARFTLDAMPGKQMQEEKRYKGKPIFTARWTAPASLSKTTLSPELSSPCSISPAALSWVWFQGEKR